MKKIDKQVIISLSLSVIACIIGFFVSPIEQPYLAFGMLSFAITTLIIGWVFIYKALK